MSTKTITVMNDAYQMLVQRKRKGESFSDLLRRVLQQRSDTMQFAGAWSDMSDEEAEQMKRRIRLSREKSTQDLKKRMQRLHAVHRF